MNIHTHGHVDLHVIPMKTPKLELKVYFRLNIIPYNFCSDLIFTCLTLVGCDMRHFHAKEILTLW